MSDPAERRGKKPATDDTPVHLPDEIIAEILVHLPDRSVIRCGAACKAWRRITTDPHFRERRRLPASVLLYTYLPEAPMPLPGTGGGRYAIDVAVDALPVSSDEAGRRRLIRYTAPAHCSLLASCNGVLLFKKDGRYLLCNPVTRQWAQLPRLPDEYYKGYNREFAFYVHRPSGEFRIICCLNRSTWYIISTAAAAPRHIIMNSEATETITRFLFDTPETTPPVVLHGDLYWPPPWASHAIETSMVMFDIVSETFHLMAGPPRREGTWPALKLLEMDGVLVVADFGKTGHVDLWFLEDYVARRWEHRHRVVLPCESDIRWPRHDLHLVFVAAAGDDGNVILGDDYGLVVYNVRRSRIVRTIDSLVVDSLDAQVTIMSRHVFKISWEQHTCFNTLPSTSIPLIHSFAD
ncbi:hypothetical protein ACP70R_005179 [Stipagrostis hirtigluma subsp. patula]